MPTPYLPLLIATSKTSGAYSDNLEYNPVFDTKERYGLYIKHTPFTLRPKPKNIITQAWKDEDGDDVFIPEKVVHEPYEFECEFLYYRMDNFANQNILAFLREIEGKWLQIYDSYTQMGRRGVYLMEVDEDATFKRRNNDYVVLKVKFKVNDPDTDITLKV